eukprot:jgi/Ulvmu1/12859/UM098_0044.1
MFYLVDLTRQVDVEPKMFGPRLEDSIKQKVATEVSGTVDASVGYILAVKHVTILGKGLIRSDGSGLATFNVQYQCISIRLWPDEVVDAEVEQTTCYGIRCRVGPFRIFVSEKNMPEDFVLRNINGHDLWVSEGEKDSVEIKEHSHVRIRIANIQLQPEKLGGVATMQGHYLGVLAI